MEVLPYGRGAAGPCWETTSAVGSYAAKYPHPWGLTDVIGNVWEWCADWHDEEYYEKSPKDDPTGPECGLHRVLRGGSWDNNARDCRASNRSWISPEDSDLNLGFRLAADAYALK